MNQSFEGHCQAHIAAADSFKARANAFGWELPVPIDKAEKADRGSVEAGSGIPTHHALFWHCDRKNERVVCGDVHLNVRRPVFADLKVVADEHELPIRR